MSLKKEISRLYYDEMLSASEVAKAIDRSKAFVLDRLHEMDGPRTIQEGTKLRSSPEYSEKIRITQLGESNSFAKLTAETVLAIRDEYEIALKEGAQKTATQMALAKEYGVKRPTISDIVLRKTWKHV